MTHPKLKQNEWVLVCDGAKALLLQNAGDHVYPKLELRDAIEHPDPQTHDLGSDTPGRVFSSKGGRHSAIEPTDLQELAEHQFLKGVAARIDKMAHGGEIIDLVIVAPPRALGFIRKEFTPAVRALIRDEIDKDLVRLPVYEIERHLT